MSLEYESEYFIYIATYKKYFIHPLYVHINFSLSKNVNFFFTAVLPGGGIYEGTFGSSDQFYLNSSFFHRRNVTSEIEDLLFQQVPDEMTS